MNYIETAKSLITRGEIRDTSANLLEDILNALLGNPISLGKVLFTVSKSPFFIREQIFWTKFETFLDGVYLDENNRDKLRTKLVENGNEKDNAFRLLDSIDRAETKQKINYLINATRCLLVNFIDRSKYFRICHAITHTLDEDLVFLGEHIAEKDIPYSPYTQGLLTAGLMYQSVIDANGEQKYSFTPLAKIVDQYAISYDNIERYPHPEILQELASPKPQLSVTPELINLDTLLADSENKE
ncbi:hypothetical protein [Hominisplanchenecus sp.]|uniref:hypothetical protein n=1 Tax=Hominisplanchenecus sp. TaxID=3038130 RepID=UPI003994EF08